MRYITTHEISITHVQLIVAVGTTPEEIITWLKQNKAKPIALRMYEKALADGLFNVMRAGSNGAVFTTKDEEGAYYYMLWLRDWDDSLESLDTLNHEVVHVKQRIFEFGDIINENEFEAYFIEHLFKELRDMLHEEMELKPKKKKKKK